MTFMPSSLFLSNNNPHLFSAVAAISRAFVPVTNDPVITSLPSVKLRVLRPIAVEIESDEYGDVIATFRDAGISMSGSTLSEAMNGLAAQIALAFTQYKKATALGPWATKQFAVLGGYVGEKVKPA